MSNNLGLVELLLVLVGALGWGAYELWALRRDRRKTAKPPTRKDGQA